MKKANYIRHALIIVFGAAILGYLVVRSWSLIRVSVNDISVDQFDEMMQNKNFILINVHVPYEGEISQTDLLIPYNALDKFKNELPKDRDAKIVVYCMSGHMGRVAAEELRSMGYTQVFNVLEGMRAWMQNGNRILYKSR